jgi:hypothetical protein
MGWAGWGVSREAWREDVRAWAVRGVMQHGAHRMCCCHGCSKEGTVCDKAPRLTTLSTRT